VLQKQLGSFFNLLFLTISLVQAGTSLSPKTVYVGMLMSELGKTSIQLEIRTRRRLMGMLRG